MKLALLSLALVCPTAMPQLRLLVSTLLNDLRLTRLAAMTIGEIAADCLSLNLGSDLAVMAWVLGALFAAALVLQLAQERPVPRGHWLAATLNSVSLALFSPAFWSIGIA
ncbi:hypothetical protein G5V57_17210 [Nordella sp. HKS 07]|uniref:hypothetical protein n=1 Tax=Nordella sp. HKS 07 TaxID=2712222 RepID=UPI0013E16DD5|nr:hypothetical protein [Nordella sp. HKS 07]QIG49306.1 hypothetical protein G5V57_17210 [Nordella sp. HKS 07]